MDMIRPRSLLLKRRGYTLLQRNCLNCQRHRNWSRYGEVNVRLLLQWSMIKSFVEDYHFLWPAVFSVKRGLYLHQKRR
uniref:Uncharacterized protein n=1 Tax=Hyaloperonospora arabidopsidis (strain Emoy2) TaxID=559515 RepID=M4BJJ7_HYAAE